MRKLILATLCLVVCTAALAQSGEPESCATFIERNRSCGDEIVLTCNTQLREKMLLQIEAAPVEFQPQMRAELATKLESFCHAFVAQITADGAVDQCRSKVATANAEQQAEWSKVKGCMKQSSCQEYADCAMEFR